MRNILFTKTGWIILAIIVSIFLLSSSCAVVKNSYVTTPYYLNATEELQRAGENKTSANGKIFAGFSKVSITPDLSGKKVPIAGYGQAKTKYATGIHDSIFVRSVALAAGADTLVIISADMLIMPPDIADSVISILARKGTCRNKLFFSATHTHSGIGGWGYGILAKLMAGKPDDDIKRWITGQIVASVVSSIADMKQTEIGLGSFNEPAYVRNRLTGDNTKINDAFDYIVIEQDSLRKCVIGTYSAHSTTTGSRNTLITGDYPGWWSHEMETRYASVAIFCGGSMGSQGPVSDAQEYEAAELIGRSLADTLIESAANIKLANEALISYISLPIDLPKYRIRLSKNFTLPSFISRGLMAEPQNVLIQALKINNLLWFFTPGDFSGEYALMLKRLYTRVYRDYYVKGSDNFKIARRKAQMGKWDEAAEYWNKELDNPKMKVAGRAAYNMAIINEINGNLDEAINWAQKSYEDYNNKLGAHYSHILEGRRYENQVLAEQGN